MWYISNYGYTNTTDVEDVKAGVSDTKSTGGGVVARMKRDTRELDWVRWISGIKKEEEINANRQRVACEDEEG